MELFRRVGSVVPAKLWVFQKSLDVLVKAKRPAGTGQFALLAPVKVRFQGEYPWETITPKGTPQGLGHSMPGPGLASLLSRGGASMAGKRRRKPEPKPPWGALNFVVNLGRFLLDLIRFFIHLGQ